MGENNTYPKLTAVNVVLQQGFDNFKHAISASYEARDELLAVAKEMLSGKEVVYQTNQGKQAVGIVMEVYPEQKEGIKIRLSRLRPDGRLTKPLNSVPIDSVIKFLEIR